MDGQGAQTAVEGFMRGWKFGSDILREREDKADRQSDRQQKKIEQGRATERFGREQKQWADQDVDRADMLAKRETPEEVIAGRKRQQRTSELGLLAAERGERQAPTDEEVRRERELGFTQKEENIKTTRAARDIARRQEDRLGRKQGMDEESNRVLAALDYLERNKELLNPEKMNSVERVYTALATENMGKLSKGDVSTAASVMLPLLDKRTEFNGLPIVERSATPLFKDGKVVMEVKYKVQQPDGSIVDADAGPLRKATADGTDAIYEIDDGEAMQMLAGHELIGRDIRTMLEQGISDPSAAIQELRRQYIESTGASGVQTLQRLDGVPESVEQVRVPLAKGLDVSVQVETNRPVTDASPIVGGVVEDPTTGQLVPAATLGDAKRVLGVQGATPAAPAAGQNKPTLQEFIAAARAKNSKMSDADLAAYHAQKYGG